MEAFCGRPWQIASLSISINFKNFDYKFGLDKYGNLKLLRSYEEEIPCNGRAKFHVSSRWVRSEMARNPILMNRFDEICTQLEKIYDVEVIIASESNIYDPIDSDLLWEWDLDDYDKEVMLEFETDNYELIDYDTIWDWDEYVYEYDSIEDDFLDYDF